LDGGAASAEFSKQSPRPVVAAIRTRFVTILAMQAVDHRALRAALGGLADTT
jgi:hypothetical protein